MKFALLLSLAMAGALAAQQPAQAPPPNPTLGVLRNLVSDLNLSLDQHKQVRSILADATSQTRQLTPKIQENRKALMDAVRSGRQDDIDKITAQNGQLQGQEEAIRMKALSQIYGLLTPDQKSKLDEKLATIGKNRGRNGAGN